MRVSGDAVLFRPAAQFGFAVESTHQFGLAKDGDDLVGAPSNPIGVLESHALSLRQGLGQIRGEGGKLGVGSSAVQRTLNVERSTHDFQEPLSL